MWIVTFIKLTLRQRQGASACSSVWVQYVKQQSDVLGSSDLAGLSYLSPH